MSIRDAFWSLAGWAIILGISFWYTTRKKHSDRSSAAAWALFVGVFGGILVATLFVVVSAAFALGIDKDHGSSQMFAAPLALLVIFPAFRYAKSLISRPPATRKRPDDQTIIQSYGRVLGQYATAGLVDETMLPYRKALIRDALIRWISKLGSESTRGHFEMALVQLSMFQPGIGQQPMYLGGISPEVLSATRSMGPEEAAKLIVNAGRDVSALSETAVARQKAEEQELINIVRSLRC